MKLFSRVDLKKLKLRRVLVLAIAICLLSLCALGLWQRYRVTHNPHPIPTNKTVTTSTIEPDETALDASSIYEVPADQPRRIMLPTIGTEGFVQKVGIDQHSAIAVPGNINVAGWFVGNTVPGNNGLSIIDGHVQGRYQPGIFKKIIQLKTGDTFSVEFGDRSTKRFEVLSVDSYPVDAVNGHLFKQQDNVQAQLNLITCGGAFDKASQQYANRVLVVSKLL